MCVYVCVCVCVRARVCVRVCVCTQLPRAFHFRFRHFLARSQSGEKRPLASQCLSVSVRSVGAQLFHGDRWTDGGTDKRDEANSRFSQFCERA
jgi:hypothetical protein